MEALIRSSCLCIHLQPQSSSSLYFSTVTALITAFENDMAAFYSHFLHHLRSLFFIYKAANRCLFDNYPCVSHPLFGILQVERRISITSNTIDVEKALKEEQKKLKKLQKEIEKEKKELEKSKKRQKEKDEENDEVNLHVFDINIFTDQF